MSTKAMSELVERRQAELLANETKVVNRINKILAESERQLEAKLKASWDKYKESGKIGQYTPAIQARAILLELMPAYGLLDAKGKEEAEQRLKTLLGEHTEQGETLGQELLRLADASVVKATSGLPTRALNALASDAADHLSRYSGDFRERAISIIGAGLASNQGIGPVSRNLREALGTTQSKAEQLVRTESLSATNAGAIKTYKENNIGLFQFLATSYDRRTCGYCVNRNMRVYQLGASIPPIHPGCRCTAMPFDPAWLQSGGYDLDWAIDYRETSLQALKQNGLSPLNQPSPFERMNNQNNPKPWWTPGEKLPASARSTGDRNSKTENKSSNDDIATKKFEWTRHGLATGKAVTVKVSDLDRAWKTDRITKDTGIGDRYKEAEKFLKTHTKVNMSEVTVNKDGSIVFTDGRHRFAVLRDSGRETIKVVMRSSKNWKEGEVK